MGKIHYGIDIIFNDFVQPSLGVARVMGTFDYLATDEPCYRPHSNSWGFETTEGKRVMINKDTIKAITWEPITE